VAIFCTIATSTGVDGRWVALQTWGSRNTTHQRSVSDLTWLSPCSGPRRGCIGNQSEVLDEGCGRIRQGPATVIPGKKIWLMVGSAGRWTGEKGGPAAGEGLADSACQGAATRSSVGKCVILSRHCDIDLVWLSAEIEIHAVGLRCSLGRDRQLPDVTLSAGSTSYSPTSPAPWKSWFVSSIQALLRSPFHTTPSQILRMSRRQRLKRFDPNGSPA
jgi:hypothetical protein